MFFGDKVLETGIFLPAGNGKVSYALCTDMAEAAANILTGSGHENEEYTILNTVQYSLQEVADILSSITGRKIIYTSPDVAVYTEALTKAGVPAEYIGVFAGFAEAIRQGEFEATSGDLENLIGRTPATLQDYFKTVYNSK